jgi:protein-S-isoprenylcysteine O-methyltransferase Ste14
MSTLALGLFVVYLLLAFVVRSVLQRRATGSTGFKGISGRVGSAEWTGGVMFVLAIVAGAVAPVLSILGALEPVEALDGAAGHAAGLVLYAAGLAATLGAQSAMGRSWRIGVDETERTDLVTSGPFALVRNPIFAAMLPTALGLALLAPNVVAVFAFAALVLALELQTRFVEEPYLLRVQGEPYRAYAGRVGRFLPGVGRLGRARVQVKSCCQSGPWPPDDLTGADTATHR